MYFYIIIICTLSKLNIPPINNINRFTGGYCGCWEIWYIYLRHWLSNSFCKGLPLVNTMAPVQCIFRCYFLQNYALIIHCMYVQKYSYLYFWLVFWTICINFRFTVIFTNTEWILIVTWHGSSTLVIIHFIGMRTFNHKCLQNLLHFICSHSLFVFCNITWNQIKFQLI